MTGQPPPGSLTEAEYDGRAGFVCAIVAGQPPTIEADTALLPRLHEFREKLTEDGLDHHDRPVVNVEAAAMAWLREEWRDDILGERNG